MICYDDLVGITGSRWVYMARFLIFNTIEPASFELQCISPCNKGQGYLSCVTGFVSTCLCLKFGKEL